MPSSSPKLIFVLLFVVNAILWSQGRYGQIQSHSLDVGHPSLAKRYLVELGYLNGTFDPSEVAGNQLECAPLTLPPEDQCAHVREVCAKHNTFLSIDYLSAYFCADTTLRPAAFAGLIIWLIFLFSTLGISASDFFTPNLATLAQLLGLDENVAGVTFLAFGNGSPDVFSTYSAMRADSGALAIGELLGAASFIVSCVVGSMCIIKPFRVHAKPFLRDVGFFTVAVSLLLGILWDGVIKSWEAGVLIALYVTYVLVVVVGTWWDRRQEKRKHREAMIRAEYEEDDQGMPTIAFHDEEPYQDDSGFSSQGLSTLAVPTPGRVRSISAPGPPRLDIQTEIPPRRLSSHTSSPVPSPRLAQMPSFSLVGALEFRQVVASLQSQAASSSLNMFDSPVTPYAGGHYHVRPSPGGRSRTHSGELDPWDAQLSAWDAAQGVPLNKRSPLPQLSLPLADEPGDTSSYNRGDSEATVAVPHISHTPASPTTTDADTESQQYAPPTRGQRLWHILAHTSSVLCPSLHHFWKKTFLGKVASLFAAPAVLALTLTLPVIVTPYEGYDHPHEKNGNSEGRLIDFEEEGIERALIAEEEVQEDMHEMKFNKWLMSAQCVLGPLFCAGVLFAGTPHLPWLMIATSVAGVAIGLLVAVFADKGIHPTAQMARCSMGFTVAIVWIMAIADEVVQVLQTFGFIFGLSDAIIGLTIFAVGNSLADLVANMSVAVFAPIMGFSACFGGPMLNILLGVGISGTYIIHNSSEPYSLKFTKTLVVSTVGLLALLLITVVMVPMNDYFLTRRWGVFLILAYLGIMVVNVFVEIKG